jgi:hypothetical protein
MDDGELSATSGQAIYEVKEQLVAQPEGKALRMLRLTIGARQEINANVEELALGRYWRPEGTNCTGGSEGNKVCYNNIIPVDYNDNINWACTAKPCGSVGLGHGYASSALSHGFEKSFFEFEGGYQPDSGIDVKLRHVSMGQVVNGQLLPFVQENPYLEFAFADNKLVGFRAGAEETWGYLGNIIDVMSGYIRPDIEVDATLLGMNVGKIKLSAFLGGVRTIGWLDTKTLTLKSTGGLTGLVVSSPDALVNQSKEAQLFPVQANYFDHTKAFFFSVGTRSIQWSPVQGFSAEVTSPGFWINMGGDGGLIATTQNNNHPNNYFPGHSYGGIYSGKTNYGVPNGATGAGGLPTWSETYQ